MFATVSIAVLVVVIILDLLYVTLRPHTPSMKESAIWVSAYTGLAVIFFGLLWWLEGSGPATEFLTGWLTEYSLSIDNLFVFIVILSGFAVPRELQQRILLVGIIIALVLRGVFILIGAGVIARFSWVFYLFGAFLLYTAIHQFRSALKERRHATAGHGAEEPQKEGLAQKLSRKLDVVQIYDGMRTRITVDGVKRFTPVLAVILALGLTDLMFAVDSIPAIFGITQDPFIVLTANLFALMGLRQLYFLLGGLLDRLIHLSYGIAIVLGFIGVKLVLHALSHNELGFINGGHHVPVPEISTMLSLVIIVGVIGLSVLTSLLSPQGKKMAALRAQGQRPREDQGADA
ncbi:MAG: TerC/Alx family metal homeostasis membrane protein [Galactobacter sp.]